MSDTAIFQFLRDVYPASERTALACQWEQWHQTRPLAGLRVLDATPLFRNTLLKHANLLAAGAELWVGYGRAMPYDATILQHLPNLGLQIPDENCLAQGFDLVLDCAGAFAEVPSRYGYVELTRSGAHIYATRNVPVVLVDAGRIKTFETALGTGDGLIRAWVQLGLPPLQQRNVVIFGCGKVGRGIAFRCQRAGAHVTMVDPDSTCVPPQGIPCVQSPSSELLQRADLIVTATGVQHALTKLLPPKILLQSPATFVNMGVEDEFGPAIPADRVLNAKAPLNFILEDPTQMRYIDPTMALHNAAALRLLEGLPPGLHPPTESEETALFNLLPADLRQELLDFESAQCPLN